MEGEKKFKKKVRSIVIGVAIVLFIFGYLYVAYLVGNVSNVGKKIKCPTYPVGYEYEGVIKAEYKSLVLIDGVYRYTDYNELYSGCFWDAGLPSGKFICSDGSTYNSGANKEETGEWVLDMEEDNCYYADSDVSMLKAIYDEKHRED